MLQLSLIEEKYHQLKYIFREKYHHWAIRLCLGGLQ